MMVSFSMRVFLSERREVSLGGGVSGASEGDTICRGAFFAGGVRRVTSMGLGFVTCFEERPKRIRAWRRKERRKASAIWRREKEFERES